MLGFYLSQGSEILRRTQTPRLKPLRTWLTVMLGWVLVMFLLPLQAMLVQLVGLRGNAFLVPFVLAGALLTGRQLGQLMLWLATLNGVVLVFALGEFVLGVPAFYPENQVTEIIYRSKDVVSQGRGTFRIPGTFANAHSYGGTMLGTFPWLVCALIQPRSAPWQRGLFILGAGAGLLGVFLTAARLSVVQLAVLLLVATSSVAAATFAGRISVKYLVVWVLLLGAIGYVVAGEERMQRFTTLKDTDMVENRVQGSVNFHFWELLVTYPMGNGLGAGGTSLPYFLQSLITNPVQMENEYSRILLEQGLVGLMLWVAFFAWCLTRPGPSPKDPWRLGWRLLWWQLLFGVGVNMIGTGMMTAIPGTVIVFLGIGFLVTRHGLAEPGRARPAASGAPAETVSGPRRERQAAAAVPTAVRGSAPVVSTPPVARRPSGRGRRPSWGRRT